MLTSVLLESTRSGGNDSLIPPSDPRNSTPPLLKSQLLIASSLGVSSFLVFCTLRRRLPQVYASRFRFRDDLPRLPNTFLSWVWDLYKVPEKSVLEYAGLDAFVYLAFFKMAIKLVGFCFFFGATVISPVRYHFTGDYDQGDNTSDHSGFDYYSRITPSDFLDKNNLTYDDVGKGGKNHEDDEYYQPFLWMYVVFIYLFTGFTAYLLNTETLKVLRIRQAYLGSQNSVTDRTIYMSGIPRELRNLTPLREHVDRLDIGKVSQVSLCYDWDRLDKLMKRRGKLLDKLNYYSCVYQSRIDAEKKDRASSGSNRTSPGGSSIGSNGGSPNNNNNSNQIRDAEDDVDESSRMLISTADAWDEGTVRLRPKLFPHWYNLLGKRLDAIEYYTLRLRSLDATILSARELNYEPTDTAFVTMESVASAQMAAQAILDPSPNVLIAHVAPSPQDIVWPNLYMSRFARSFRSWAVTAVVTACIVALVFPVSYIATLLNIDTISKFWPAFGRALKSSPTALVLVTGFLPTLLFSLLNVLVPYMFVWLSSFQGYISKGDTELSVIEKVYAYVFFNLFLVLTIARTASNYMLLLKDTTRIAYLLATSIRDLSLFYADLIILQGIGMYPFRLLDIGTLIQLPVGLLSRNRAKREITDRQRRLHARTASGRVQRLSNDKQSPRKFNLGLFLPMPILILNLCIIYSVLSTKILAAGLIYFFLGYMVSKYHLLYCTEHVHHSTGRAWPVIFYRVSSGLILFQLTLAGTLALQQAYFLASFLTPLPILTLVFIWDFYKNLSPLATFIALKSIQQAQSHRPRSGSRTVDEIRELGTQYINPSLVDPLEPPAPLVVGEEV